MEVDVPTIVRWSARSVGIAVAAFFLLKLGRETLPLLQGGANAAPAGGYLLLSLLWLAALGLLVGLRWPFLGGFITLALAVAVIMILLLSGRGVQPDVALVAAAATLDILDGSMRAGKRSQSGTFS